MKILIASLLLIVGTETMAQTCSDQSQLGADKLENSKIRELAPRYLEAAKACEDKKNNWKKGNQPSVDFGSYFKGAAIDCDSEMKNIASFIEALVIYSKTDKTFDEIFKNQYALTQSDVLGIKSAYQRAQEFNEKNVNQPWVQNNNRRMALKKLQDAPSTSENIAEMTSLKNEMAKVDLQIEAARLEHKKLFEQAKQSQGELSRINKGDNYITPFYPDNLKTKELITVLKEQLNQPKVCWDVKEKSDTSKDCPAVTDIPLPKLDCGAPLNPKGFKSVKQLWEISKNKELSCNDRSLAIRKVFQNFKSSIPEDIVVMKMIAQNAEMYFKNPTRLQILGGALEAAEPVPLGGAEDVAPSFSGIDLTYSPTSFINARMAIIAELKKSENLSRSSGETARQYNDKICELARKSEDGAGIKLLSSVFDKLTEDNGLCSTAVSADKRAEIISEATTNMEKVFAEPGKLVSNSREFAAYCDHKVARIFGNENAVASVCGHDNVKASSSAGLSAAEADSLSKGLDRAHVFMNMHIYPNKAGSGQGEFFAPLGATSASAGSMVATQGSYNLTYPKLGRYKNVILNINHLGTPSKLTNYKNSQLARPNGTVAVGTIGGVGGEGDGYRHSHVQILVGGNKRLNFVDAFCRD